MSALHIVTTVFCVMAGPSPNITASHLNLQANTQPAPVQNQVPTTHSSRAHINHVQTQAHLYQIQNQADIKRIQTHPRMIKNKAILRKSAGYGFRPKSARYKLRPTSSRYKHKPKLIL
ncbi:hypothetical protein CROQUDRAFT_657892 [Cronartium quercuum f. sp. fusiforme G11]|uniref:Uncharacterized protein n=1 Tax=Cronartium quercuum f. sp. fusiforme G11 TaxID=708437 RepID=A0A9P6TCY4_9BASI|nr:hypothetical protein CROQUDRAFT_657892 [Cronartium quercuum f. sp. fusiforme G11]